jgi:hypothetical protein
MADPTAVYWTLWSCRLTFNFTLLCFHPFIVALGTEVLDLFDAPLWTLTNGTSVDYNRYDKLADLSFYFSALIYLIYFFDCLRWPRWILGLTCFFLFYRAIGNIASSIWPAVDWIPIAFPNCGGLLFELYSFLDFFRIMPGRRSIWHLPLTILVIGVKLGQEFYLRWHWEGLGPAQCNTVGYCLAIWSTPTLAFLVIGLWAGYWQPPMWHPRKAFSYNGIYARMKGRSNAKAHHV